ncbi:hypothetical protein ACFU44_00715 [Nocardia rhizosphaerihabitans]|uniref:DUF7448 domain-containing protein n=1 Tax=Nocardia rhizosphaerihabitans TaxID=1691570 RepID=UPI00366DF2E7
MDSNKYPVKSALIGRKVTAVRMNDDVLIFETDQGPVGFRVWGDCCSHSYFHDFYGLDKLRENGPVIEFNEISLPDPEPTREYDDCVQAYGYEIVTEHKMFGPQTSVFSFRNSSNGYYGGEMEEFPDWQDITRLVEETPLLAGDFVVLD